MVQKPKKQLGQCNNLSKRDATLRRACSSIVRLYENIFPRAITLCENVFLRHTHTCPRACYRRIHTREASLSVRTNSSTSQCVKPTNQHHPIIQDIDSFRCVTRAFVAPENESDCFCYHSSRHTVVIVFETPLSLPLLQASAWGKMVRYCPCCPRRTWPGRSSSQNSCEIWITCLDPGFD